jgi:hypothetical protein
MVLTDVRILEYGGRGGKSLPRNSSDTAQGLRSRGADFKSCNRTETSIKWQAHRDEAVQSLQCLAKEER